MTQSERMHFLPPVIAQNIKSQLLCVFVQEFQLIRVCAHALLSVETANLRCVKINREEADYKFLGCVHSDDSQPQSPLFTVYQPSKLRQNDMSPRMQFCSLIRASLVTSLSLTVAINSRALLFLRLHHSNQEQKGSRCCKVR